VLADVQGIVTTKTASVGADISTTNVIHAYLYLNYVHSVQLSYFQWRHCYQNIVRHVFIRVMKC